MGINPTTTVDVCNTLISNVLTTLSFHHKNIVNVIPLLDEERQRWPSAVKWYATVVVDFCRSLTRQCPIQTTDTKIPSAVGAGFIPVLPAADKIQNKYNATARMGINPTPMLDACNTLITKMLLM